MSLSWEAPNQWNRSIRFILGAVTIWPLVYIPLFVFGIFLPILWLIRAVMRPAEPNPNAA